jgi:hypothetical protein
MNKVINLEFEKCKLEMELEKDKLEKVVYKMFDLIGNKEELNFYAAKQMKLRQMKSFSLLNNKDDEKIKTRNWLRKEIGFIDFLLRILTDRYKI